jgi:TonB family protein
MTAFSTALVLAIAIAICRAVRHRSTAAFRHLVLTAAFTVALLVPLAVPLITRTEPVRRIQSMVVINVTPDRAAPAPRRSGGMSLPDGTGTMLWLAGAGLCLVRLGYGLLARRRAARPATSDLAAECAGIASDLGIRRSVSLQLADNISVPETLGLFRPVVQLPAQAQTWPKERLRVVLTHELIHVRRGDWISGLVGEITAALHWFNPLAWLALRHLRREREIACDDAVVAHGVDGCAYAGHLLDIVAGIRSTAPAASVAMAEMSHLELRIRSILDPRNKTGGTSMKTKLGVAASAAIALITAAGLQGLAQTGTAGLSGTVLDASSGRVPGSVVMIRDVANGKREITRSDAAGEFRFSSLPAGTYDVEISKPGFQMYRQQKLTLAPGSAQHLSVVLSIGKISENVEVTGKRTSAAPPPPAATGAPQRLRIGGGVQYSKMRKMVRPEYPVHLKEAGIEGTVLLDAVIGRDGKVINLKAVNSLVHEDLTKAAVDAVGQWEYEPTHLNGNPVEVMTQITVNFTLQK